MSTYYLSISFSPSLQLILFLSLSPPSLPPLSLFILWNMYNSDSLSHTLSLYIILPSFFRVFFKGGGGIYSFIYPFLLSHSFSHMVIWYCSYYHIYFLSLSLSLRLSLALYFWAFSVLGVRLVLDDGMLYFSRIKSSSCECLRCSLRSSSTLF